MSARPFKVVIVGGSLAGLSLANMPQANDIDFVVLEAYPEIAPQVGASIGVLPHGNRILDQLGLFERVRDLATSIDRFTFRNQEGNPIASHGNVQRAFVNRHGYPILFLDRQMLLQVLYDNIKDKSKVITRARVTKIRTTNDGAAAMTINNDVYEGDIVIGADGIHSTVRSEMWKLAQKLRPNWFDPSEEEAAPCAYNCLFGISEPCPGIDPGAMNSIFREKTSYLIIGGPNRTYWFRFEKLPTLLHGSQIPRYTAEDAKRAISRAYAESITPSVKFSTLAKNAIKSSMTPLVEYVFRKWYFGRIVCIGDSSHKVHPIGGHGGNAAIESAATLTNLLVETLKNAPSGHLETSEIEHIYSRMQKIRHDRMEAVKLYSHEQQRTEALDSVWKKVQALYALPHVDAEAVTFNFSSNIPASEKLDMFEVARGDRLVPFNDDLVSVPKRRKEMQWALIIFYLLVAALVRHGMWIHSKSWSLEDKFVDILTTGTFPQDQAFTLKRIYTRIGPLDEYLTFLTAVFIPGLRGWEKSYQILQIYFLGNLLQPIAIWTVEARRIQNMWTPIAFPILWFTIFQSAGIGIYMPIYYAVYTFISDAESYWWSLNRRIPMEHSKTILPATLIGYALPTILMFVHWDHPSTAQNFEVLWQFAPMLVPFLLTVSGAVYRRLYKIKSLASVSDYSEDIPYLKNLYAITGILGVILHFTIMAKLLGSSAPNISVRSVFGPDFAPGPKSLGEGLRNLFLVDFLGFVLATYVWCVSAVWDLKRVGRTTVHVGKASLLLLVAHVFIGPGAVHSAVWYWREERLGRTMFIKQKKN